MVDYIIIWFFVQNGILIEIHQSFTCYFYGKVFFSSKTHCKFILISQLKWQRIIFAVFFLVMIESESCFPKLKTMIGTDDGSAVILIGVLVSSSDPRESGD